MAEDEIEMIQNALNIIVSTAEPSSNMKKNLKQTIFDTVSTLTDLCIQLKTSRDSKSQIISELEWRVASMKAEMEAFRDAMVRYTRRHPVAGHRNQLGLPHWQLLHLVGAGGNYSRKTWRTEVMRRDLQTQSRPRATRPRRRLTFIWQTHPILLNRHHTNARNGCAAAT
jgi:hypothetical protein